MRPDWHKASMAFVVCAVATACLGVGFASSSQAAAPEPKTSFKKQVLPIFQEYCSACHTPGGVGYISSNLDLGNYRQLRMGSAGGVAVIPYHPELSPLIKVLKDDWHSKDKNALKMPPLGPQLAPKDIDVISKWIKEGAKDN